MSKVSHGVMPTALTINNLSRLSIDRKGNLYWNNKPVIIEEKLKLAWWLNAAIILGSFSTFGLLLLGIVRFFIKQT